MCLHHTVSVCQGGLSIALVVSLLGAVGCDPPPRPPVADRHAHPLVDALSGVAEGKGDPAEVPPQSAQDAAGAAGATDTADATDAAATKFTPPAAGDGLSLPWETWDAYYIGDQHIGFAHVRATAAGERGRRYQLHDQMTLRRGATRLTHQVTQDSREDAAGQLQAVTATLHNGPAVTRVEGARRDDKLVIELTRGNEHTRQELPWKSHYHGLLGVQQSLRREPLLPGGRRRIAALLPVQYQIGEFQLQATGKVSIPLLDGESRMLTEIRSRLQLGPAGSIDTYLWIDDAGETLKTYTPALNLTAYRTDQATATAAVSAQRDLLSLASIQLQGPSRLADPLNAQQVRFRLTATPPPGTATPPGLPALSAAVGQRVETIADPPSLHVQVRAGLDTEAAVAAVGPRDLAANPLIDFHDRGISAIVKALAVNPSESPRDTVLQTVGFVHEFIQNKDFSRGFAAASEVALDPRGDCTEHAVLLAAILRSRKIPTRVVAGLTYVPTASGPEMMYHMWNVAYVDEGWLPVDATLGTIAPASRIALVTSDLSSGNEYECLNPILGVMGRLEIEVLAD